MNKGDGYSLAHTPLARILQKSYAVVHADMENRISNGHAMMPENNFTKKTSIPPKSEYKDFFKIKRERKNAPRIVIVGAGLAGLTCAHRLKQAGISATIYEATDRVGGRCWTRRGDFKEAQIAERGGELIDTGHGEIQGLAKELGLVLDNLIKEEAIDTEPLYFFDGCPYTFKDATKDFLEIYPKLQSDLIEAGETTLYNRFTERGFELDHMSIIDYINETVPGGINSKFGQLLAVAYTVENGAEAHEQSSLNLLYMLGSVQKDLFQIYGDSDERYHIKGGNDQLPALLAEKLNGQINFNYELIKIEQKDQNEIRLVFRKEEKEWEVWADKVVLTLPFKILKTIGYESAGFRPLKKMAIEELGMGMNTKLHAQFSNRFWRKLGNNGETFADTGYQQTFEASRAQQGHSGILVGYSGGETAAKQFALEDEQVKEITKDFLDKLEPVLPGSKRNWNGLSKVDHWPSNKWTKGAYSYFKVGQYTKFAGIEGEREGNTFFAGEHTSIDYKGYLNGAVETGERAAQEIINDLN